MFHPYRLLTAMFMLFLLFTLPFINGCDSNRGSGDDYATDNFNGYDRDSGDRNDEGEKDNTTAGSSTGRISGTSCGAPGAGAGIISAGGNIADAENITPVIPGTRVYTERQIENYLIYLINNERTKAGLQPLLEDVRASFAARKHSYEMKTLRYFAHRSPVLENATLCQRLSGAGVGFSEAEENIAICDTGEAERTARNVHRAFMENEKKKAAILGARYESIGIGCIMGEKIYITEIFLRNGTGCGKDNTEYETTPSGNSNTGSTTNGGTSGTISQDTATTSGCGGATGIQGTSGNNGQSTGQGSADSSGISGSNTTTGGKFTVQNFPPQKNFNRPELGTILNDIEQHLPSRYGTQYRDSSPMTWAHETTHGINSHIRNYMNNTGRRANGFYIPGGRAVLIEEPRIKKSAAARYIPQSLRGFRFGTYITGQQAWEDTPLYIFDEWVAYTNGAACGVELVEKGLYRGEKTDAVAGALEFTIYAFGLAMAIEQQDPSYFQQNSQFREFLAWHAIRAMDLYRRGSNMSEFNCFPEQHRLYRTLTVESSGEPIRQFIKRVYGEAYLKRLLTGQ